MTFTTFGASRGKLFVRSTRSIDAASQFRALRIRTAIGKAHTGPSDR